MQTPRYGPRGGAPCRNVTSIRRPMGSQRAASACPAQEGGGSTRHRRPTTPADKDPSLLLCLHGSFVFVSSDLWTAPTGTCRGRRVGLCARVTRPFLHERLV
eukprot:7385525-Prymnesium_polylepis.1